MVILLFIAVGDANGKEKVTVDLAQRFRERSVTVLHRTVTVGREEGKEYLMLSEEPEEGLVWLNGVSFSTGTIEVDLKGQDVYQHSFVGIAFHGADDSTFEAIYFRPFQFRTEDTARQKRGVQYVSLPQNTWQVLRAEHPGVYEQPVIPGPDPNGWFHASFVITRNEVTVFVNNSTVPCLRVKLLSGRKNGKIGLYTADRSGGSFANLSIESADRLTK
jgi:hypothetical protein